MTQRSKTSGRVSAHQEATAAPKSWPTTAAASRLRPDRPRNERGAGTERPRERGPVDYLSIKADLHERLLDEIGDKNLLGAGEEAVETAVRVANLLRDLPAD